MLDVLDASSVRRWCQVAVEGLGKTKAEIDALNVFPVPDADTGTNLHLTMLAAAEAVDQLPPDAGPAETWQALVRGALLGARGNSGVILSQTLRGLADVLADTGPGGGKALRDGLTRASSLAYSCVRRPVEGTILTVLRGAADACLTTPSDDLATVLRAAVDGARTALRRTPEQLDVLARAGVVDAAGVGLVVVLEALLAVVTGEYPDRYAIPARRVPTDPVEPATSQAVGSYGYEVMYLLDAADEAVNGLMGRLDELGDSLVVVGGDGLWNVHVHVDDAGAAIEAGMSCGRPHRIRVTYLGGRQRTDGPPSGRGVVAVAAGDGLASLFAEAGAGVVRREPGSSVSLAPMLDAIRRSGSEVIVLPNDSTVAAVAEAAAECAREEGIRVTVLPTKASVQGLAALAVHDPARRYDDDVVAMTNAAGATRYGQIGVSQQDAVTSAGICRAGSVLGLVEGDVITIAQDFEPAACQVVDRLLSGGGELVTLITGADATSDLTKAVREQIAKVRPDAEVLVYEGGQGVYPLLIGVE